MDSQKSKSYFLKRYCSLKPFYLIAVLLGIFLFSISGIVYAQYQMKTPQSHPKAGEAYIKVTHPDQDEVWEKGKIHKIRWESKGVHGNVKILLVGQNIKPIEIARNTINSGLFSFIVPRNLHDGYYIIQVMKVDGSVKGESSATITIGNPKFRSVKVTPQKEQEKVVGVNKSVTQTGAAPTGGAVGAKIPQGEATPSTAGTTGLAKQQSGMSGTTEVQQKPSASLSTTKATPEELAAINRLCDGLHRIKSNLQQLKGPLSETRKMNSELKQVSMKIKQDSLTPHSEKGVVEKKTSGGGSEKSSGLTPAEKTKGQIGVRPQMEKIIGNMKRIKERVILIKTNNEQEWKKMEGDLRKVSGSPRITSYDRLCISKEVKGIEKEVASLQSQANNLKSQMDDLRSQLDQQYGQGSCADLIGQDCNSAKCEECCGRESKQNVVAEERCSSQCMLKAELCKAHSIFDKISDILKDAAERQTSNVGQLGNI